MGSEHKVLLPDHLMYAQAVDALKRYNEAKDQGRPEADLDRLRKIAEAQFAAVTEYQMNAFGKPRGNSH